MSMAAVRPYAEAGATSEQLDLVRWAVGRFEIAGLEPPHVEIEFHGDPSGCGGHFGFALEGQVDVCTTLVNAMTRRLLLHEMSHIWLDEHVGAGIRARFLELRQLASWNASSDPWALRGYEQGAEIISWALGERILSPQVPDTDPDEIASGYELLTGRRFPSAIVDEPQASSSTPWIGRRRQPCGLDFRTP
jgi:hypothetical protein